MLFFLAKPRQKLPKLGFLDQPVRVYLHISTLKLTGHYAPEKSRGKETRFGLEFGLEPIEVYVGSLMSYNFI
jgi:hypothetical protein